MKRPRRPIHRAALAATTAAVLLLSACSGSDDSPGPSPDEGGGGTRDSGDTGSGGDAGSAPASGSYPGLPDALAQQRVQWNDCEAPTPLQGSLTGAPGSLEDGTPWQCGTLTVPLDYDDPEGETIDIALIRAVSSAGAEERIGSLVFNFGGPGGSGVASLPSYGEEFEALHARYDLVSFDPRGVGESAGVVCEDDAEKNASDQDPAGPPDTPAEEQEMLDEHAEYLAACEREAGPLLPHLTTTNTARDLDLLRHALGDGRLNYVGFSYGTELGGVYAHLFPERVGRTVLDSVVDPTITAAESSLRQAEGFQLALDNYLDDCAAQFAENPGDCPFLARASDGTAAITGLLNRIQRQPLPTTQDPGGREVTYGLAMTAIAASLYSADTWEYLTSGLTEAILAGTGDTLLALADLYNGRDDQGRYSNQDDAGFAIGCADTTGGRGSVADVRALEDEFAAASPVFGEYLMWSAIGCTDWPVPGESATPEVAASDVAEPILLVATTGDPATPYEGAARMQEELGGPDVAPLLTFEGEGHGAYTEGNACVRDTVNAHLLDGELPPDGKVCT